MHAWRDMRELKTERLVLSGSRSEGCFRGSNKIKNDIDFIQNKSYIQFKNTMHDDPSTLDKTWLDFLEDEDLAFIKRLVLFSGSLKDLATAYDVTYPTVRLRLDRLIAKIKVFDDNEIQDDFERQLRATYAEGKIDGPSFKRLLGAYRKGQKENG